MGIVPKIEEYFITTRTCEKANRGKHSNGSNFYCSCGPVTDGPVQNFYGLYQDLRSGIFPKPYLVDARSVFFL